MTRITKEYSERKEEIISTALQLFYEKGYNNVSIAEIIGQVNIAKGTFYHYFKSKDELLEEIVNTILVEYLENAKKISEKSLPAIDKLKSIFSTEFSNYKIENIKNTLHQPENRELHERLNVKIVNELSPIITKIIEQGIGEGVFEVENVLYTVQFLLVASQFFFDEGLFEFKQEELILKRKAMQTIFEKSMGSKKGLFKFLIR